jgi:hypothetical protein
MSSKFYSFPTTFAEPSDAFGQGPTLEELLDLYDTFIPKIERTKLRLSGIGLDLVTWDPWPFGETKPWFVVAGRTR